VFDEVRFVLAQKFYFSNGTPSQRQIDEHLLNLGLQPEENYYYGNQYLSVTDVNATSDNVLIGDDGRLLFIDPIIKMKRPIDEIIAAYPFVSKSDKKQGFFSYIKRLFRE